MNESYSLLLFINIYIDHILTIDLNICKIIDESIKNKFLLVKFKK